MYTAAPPPPRIIGASLSDVIAEHALRRPEAPALIGPDGEVLTYSELAAGIQAFGAALSALGVPAGSALGILIPHSLDAAVATIAVECHGAHVALNPSARPEEHRPALERLRPRAIVTVDDYADDALAAAAQHGTEVIRIAGRQRATLPVERIRAGLPPPFRLPRDIVLVLRSSGTTGTPKFVPLTWQNLKAKAETFATLAGLTSDDRSACTAPLHLAMGLELTLHAPLMLGASAAVPPAEERDRIDRWAARLQPTWLASTPASLRAMVEAARRGGPEAIPRSVRFVLCGSSAVPERLRTEAEAALGVPVLSAYGLSEAGLVSIMPPAGPAQPDTVGVPLAGRVAVLGPDGAPLAPGAEGEVAVTGPTVTGGYLSEDGVIAPRPEWFPTGDVGRLDVDGMLRITGRSKEMINRGGEKISPYEIENALLAHPDILEAAVYPIPHARLGETAAAAIVLRPGAELAKDGYRAFLARRLARAKLPDPVTPLAALPRSDAGKILRRELAARHARNAGPAVPPDGLLELQIHAVWTRLLGRDDVGVDEDFFAAGGDSLLSVEMMIAVEAVTGRPVPAVEPDRPMTIRELARLILLEPVEQTLIEEPREKTGAPPLFFCHGDYLTRGLYARHLADLTAGQREMYLVAPPLEAMARGPAPFAELARDYIPRLLELQPEGPFVLGGFCNGGMLAWELARQLIARGRKVDALILVDTLSVNLRPEMRLAQAIAGAVSIAAAPFGLKRATEEALVLLAWKAFRGELWDTLARKLWRGPGAADEKAAGAAPPAHAFYPIGAYRFRPLPTRVYCIGCEGSRERPEFDPRQWRRIAPDAKHWTIPGEHWTCITVHVDRLAAAMSEILSETGQPQPAARLVDAAGPAHVWALGATPAV